MKKIIALLLALVLALSLVACGSSAPSTSGAASSEIAEEVPSSDSEPAEPESQPEETPAEGGSDVTVATMLSQDFVVLLEEGEKSALEIAEGIIGNEEIPFGPVAVEVAEGYLPGFTEDITGFEEGATFAPMIGSIPFVGYVFRLADEDTAKAFMENLKEKADTRWNICTEADEIVSYQHGSWVYFAMGPTSFED